YFPAGLIALDNPLVNWIAGVGNDSLYISLTNSAGTDQQVVVDLATELTGAHRAAALPVEVIAADGSRSNRAARRGQIAVTVPARGLVAL
ncbi:hypothetical protein, partial [Burkholderia sp. SIMBA_024]